MNLRIFCAIAIPDAVKEQLLPAVSVLKAGLPEYGISWVKPENFHITLSFLGDVDEKRVPQLVEALDVVISETKPFYLVCEQLGCFPNASRPRVLWAGVRSEADELSTLQEQIASVCTPFAQRAENGRFHGHVTLGRIKPHAKMPKAAIAGELERGQGSVFGKWNVEHVHLIRSDLSSGAPRYSTVHLFPLYDANRPEVRTP